MAGRSQPGQYPRSEKNRGVRYDPSDGTTPKKSQVKRYRLDQHGIAGPVGTEIQRITAAGVIHVDVAAIKKQRLAFVGIAQRGVAALVGKVIGFSLDNPCAEPQAVDPMANDFTQQFAGNKLGVTVEKGIRQHCGHVQDGQWIAEKGQIIASHA